MGTNRVALERVWSVVCGKRSPGAVPTARVRRAIGLSWVTFVASCCGVAGFLGEAAAVESAVVFVSRELKSEPQPEGRASAIERASAGRLLVREASGEVRVLVDGRAAEAGSPAPVDVLDPDVSYDGQRIVFAGFSLASGAWRVYEVSADGGGLRQVTTDVREADMTRYGAAAAQLGGHDDLDPCYLPDGRICFVSTRYPGVAPDGRLRTTNLYVVNADGTDLHRITTERFGADTPVVEPSTGRIVYSRWWRSGQVVEVDLSDNGEEPTPVPPVPPGSPGYGDAGGRGTTGTAAPVLRGIPPEEFPGVNSWFLAGVRPDGTELSMWSGFRLDRGLTQAYKPAFLPNGAALALFIPRTPFIGYPRGDGLRIFRPGPLAPSVLGGPQTFEPGERLGAEFLFASAAAFPDGDLVVTAASPRDPADYDVYVRDALDSELRPLYQASGSAELDAQPLLPRPVPPVLPDSTADVLAVDAPRDASEAFRQGGRFTFTAENIFFNAPVDVDIVNAPPVGKRMAIEFYMNPQRTSPSIDDAPILLKRVEIPPSGRVEVELPAGVPLFEALRLPNGDFPLGRDGQIYHVGGLNFGRAGETSRCVGCHAGHSQIAVPEDASWTNVAPGAEIVASSARSPDGGFDSFFRPQNLVDRRTERRSSEWAARDGASASVELRWSAAVRAREVIVYGPQLELGSLGPRDQVIRGVTLTTFLGEEAREQVRVDRAIQPSGTAAPLDGDRTFDRLVVTIRREDVSGIYEGETGPALAEIEVIAQAAGEPRGSFLRGDANCDGRAGIDDAISLLGRLFRGQGPLCCEAAADTDANDAVNLSDAVYLLNFFFAGGLSPSAPFPQCGPGTSDALSCGQQICPSGQNVRPNR